MTLTLSIYKAVLPIFKKYVMLFQREEPLIHKVHFEQIDIIKTFLSYFVKPEKLSQVNTGRKLKKLEISEDDMLPNDMLFVGTSAKKIISKLGPDNQNVVNFFQKVRTCYLSCAKYIKEKLPLENEFLMSITCIDPELVTGNSKTVLKKLLSLPTLISVLPDEELDIYDGEARKIFIDCTLPSPFDDKGKEVRCLDWWLGVSDKYPILFKVVTAILSIFHGPRVESSFSVMGDVIDAKSGRIDIKTFDAIQTVKYSLYGSQVNQLINGGNDYFGHSLNHLTYHFAFLSTSLHNATPVPSSISSDQIVCTARWILA